MNVYNVKKKECIKLNKIEIIFIILELIMNSYEIYQGYKADKKLNQLRDIILSERKYKVR